MHGEPLQILLVEDNEDHAEIVQREFMKHRIANCVHWVSDGEQAMEYLFRKGPFASASDWRRPNLILLDLRLPKLDGTEVLKRIRETPSLAAIPVVVLTTSAAERDVTAAYNQHVNSYLVKPIDFSQFGELMNILGYYWLAWNQNPWPPREMSVGETG